MTTAYAHVQQQESLEDARDSYRAVDTAEYRRHLEPEVWA